MNQISGNWINGLRNNVEQHINYIIEVGKKIGLVTHGDEEFRRAELWSLPIEDIYKVSKEAEEAYKVHKEVEMLNRVLDEVEEHGKEYVLKKYLSR